MNRQKMTVQDRVRQDWTMDMLGLSSEQDRIVLGRLGKDRMDPDMIGEYITGQDMNINRIGQDMNMNRIRYVNE